MAGEVRRHQIANRVAVQLNYLNAGPRHGEGVCRICFGATTSPWYQHCYQCEKIQRRAHGLLADLVVPITYRNGHEGQHSRDLRMYKKNPASEAARKNLAVLFRDFCVRHIRCVKKTAGVASFTHVAFVPSTKNPGQAHPLQTLLAPTVRSLRRIDLGVNRDVSPGAREFHQEWFLLDEIPDPRPQTAVLLVDDTWVSGARAQSAAHRLKQAGAHKVVTVVLARQLEPSFPPAQPLVNRITRDPFDPTTCAVHEEDAAGGPSVAVADRPGRS